MTDFESIMRPAGKALKQQERKEFVYVYWWHLWVLGCLATVWGMLVAGIWFTHIPTGAKLMITSLVTFLFAAAGIGIGAWVDDDGLADNRRGKYHTET